MSEITATLSPPTTKTIEVPGSVTITVPVEVAEVIGKVFNSTQICVLVRKDLGEASFARAPEKDTPAEIRAALRDAGVKSTWDNYFIEA